MPHTDTCWTPLLYCESCEQTVSMVFTELNLRPLCGGTVNQHDGRLIGSSPAHAHLCNSTTKLRYNRVDTLPGHIGVTYQLSYC